MYQVLWLFSAILYAVSGYSTFTDSDSEGSFSARPSHQGYTSADWNSAAILMQAPNSQSPRLHTTLPPASQSRPPRASLDAYVPTIEKNNSPSTFSRCAHANDVPSRINLVISTPTRPDHSLAEPFTPPHLRPIRMPAPIEYSPGASYPVFVVDLPQPSRAFSRNISVSNTSTQFYVQPPVGSYPYPYGEQRMAPGSHMPASNALDSNSPPPLYFANALQASIVPPMAGTAPLSPFQRLPQAYSPANAIPQSYYSPQSPQISTTGFPPPLLSAASFSPAAPRIRAFPPVATNFPPMIPLPASFAPGYPTATEATPSATRTLFKPYARPTTPVARATTPPSSAATRVHEDPNAQGTAQSTQKVVKKPCRCGSLTHQRTNNAFCPLNPDKRWKIGPDNTLTRSTSTSGS